MNSQLKKGVLEIFILKIIENDQPIYGYDIMKKISVIFEDIDKATVYSILRRLYSTSLLDIEILKSTEGPQRKYYKLTDIGKKTLCENVLSLKKLVDISKDLGII